MSTRLFGTLCMIGALYEMSWSLTREGIDSRSTLYLVLWSFHLIAFPCLMGGPLALRRLDAFGSGWIARMGKLGMIVTLLGLALYTIESTLTLYFLSTGGAVDAKAPPAYMLVFAGLSALSTGLGMLILGIAVLAAKRQPGWHALVPLAVGVVYFVQLVPQLYLRLNQGQLPVGFILVFWWLAWLLLGYSITSQRAELAPATS